MAEHVGANKKILYKCAAAIKAEHVAPTVLHKRGIEQ
jgi:hypothetical protein